MDCAKIGKLIFTLRNEKNMTQKQLADTLNLSNKTISKWERGLGCPDVSLLPELSNIFNVNIEDILSGDLETSETQGGNMKRTKFYYCPDCGNVLTSTTNKTLTCCSRKLEPLVARKQDSEHTMTMEQIEYDHFIKFDHPMTKDHYISFFAYVDMGSLLLIKLYPEQNPEIRVSALRKGKKYYYCTKHGLFEY